jgi:hypothetical protein
MNYISKVTLEKTTALATYGKSSNGPLELNLGSEKQRLKFSLDTSVANVYVEVVGDSFLDSVKSFFLSLMNRKFVKCMYGDKTLYINVNSLANRIGINPAEVYSSAENQSTLNLLIENGHKKYLDTEKKIDTHLQNIIKEKYRVEGEKLIAIDKEQINRNTLRKMIGIAAFSSFNTEGDAGYQLNDGTILHLKREKGCEWPLLTLFTTNVLGKGANGRVVVVQELSQGRCSVAKMALYYKDDIENENIILTKIFHKNPNVIGIQKKPYSLFEYKIGNEIFFGYISLKYARNLREIKLKKEQKIECIRQLLKGLVELAQQEICHGDIKEDNCLVKTKDCGSVECVIADFGGAGDLSSSIKWPYGTAAYKCHRDWDSYRSLKNRYHLTNTKEMNDNIVKEAKTLALRRDVYAMGIVLENVLNLSFFKAKSEKLENLVGSMKKTDWKARISAEVALEEFEKIFPSNKGRED